MNISDSVIGVSRLEVFKGGTVCSGKFPRLPSQENRDFRRFLKGKLKAIDINNSSVKEGLYIFKEKNGGDVSKV